MGKRNRRTKQTKPVKAADDSALAGRRAGRVTDTPASSTDVVVAPGQYSPGVVDREQVSPPADLELVRGSYDRVADNYVAMQVGDLAPHPWLRAALTAFAEDVR